MQVRCVKAFGNAKPGEIVSGLPDGAMADPEHWEIVPDAPPVPAGDYDPPEAHAPPLTESPPAFPLSSAAAVTPKEM
jgi:hypothetical protein